jgi:YaiO family outer membrane protein
MKPRHSAAFQELAPGRAALASALGALALGFAAPAFGCTDAVQAAREELAAHPDHSDAREVIARDCARAGRPAEALAQYDELLKVNADNPDWLLGRAQALLALGRPAEALPNLEHARQVAPAYEDVWQVNATALERAGRSAEAETLLADAERQFPKADWPGARRRALHDSRLVESGNRIALAASYEDLSDGLESWKAATLDASHQLNDRQRIFGGLNAEERYGEQDFQFSAGLATRLTDDWSVSVSGDVTGSAEFLPDWSVTGEVGRRLPGGRGLSLRARHTEFESVDVDALAATFEQYLAAVRFAYTLTASTPSDLGWYWSHGLRVAHDYGEGSHVTLALGYGKEAETVAPGVVLVTRDKSVALYGLHWTSAAWGFAWEAGWYRQGTLYDRVRVRFGVEHRF